MNTDLVRYACRAKAHLEASPNAAVEPGSPVTIHEGAWAYCPAGVHAAHEWEPIEAVTLADLKLVEAVRPREAAPEDLRS